MLDIITDHIDIWTSAKTPKANGGRGRSKNGEQTQYGIKKLRELILELAVRGKLVPQDPDDEPASMLLEKIAKEKVKLIKIKKINEKRPLSNITKEEKKFELPKGWAWSKLGNICEFINGFAFKSSDFTDTGIGVVRIGDIQDGEISTNRMVRVSKKAIENLDDSLAVKNGEMVIAMSGATTGKLGFNKTNQIFYLNQRVGKISPYFLPVKYLYYPLSTKISENLEKSMGSAIPNLSTAQIKDIVLAIPPVNEQHRIIAKVDELMALCDQLEQQQTDSDTAHKTLVETLLGSLTNSASADDFQQTWKLIENNFDTLFTTEHSIDQLKQAILQLAVMGKLVPQDPKDEPASELLKRIAEEREKLIKQGRIKRQKTDLGIEGPEKPFKLPESWEWIRFGTIAHQITDGAHHTPAYVSKGIPFLSVKDMSTGKLDFSDTRYISIEQHENLIKRCCPEKGDLLLTKVGTTGIPVLIDTSDKFSIFVSVALIKFPQDKILGPYLTLLINSPFVKSQSEEGTEGIGNKNLVLRKIATFLLTIPPLNEQHRIVAKANELIALCDSLKTRLNEAKTTQIHLADTIVKQDANVAI